MNRVLVRADSLVNKTKVYRLSQEFGLVILKKWTRTRASHLRVPPSPTQPGSERWAIDSVHDRTRDERSLRGLTAIDAHTHECLVLIVRRSLSPARVIDAVERAIAAHSKPQRIICDNGAEFTSDHFDARAYQRGVALGFILPGRKT